MIYTDVPSVTVVYLESGHGKGVADGIGATASIILEL